MLTPFTVSRLIDAVLSITSPFVMLFLIALLIFLMVIGLFFQMMQAASREAERECSAPGARRDSVQA
jgi:hypothetical protein